VTLFIPETPKYYFAMKRYDDARRVFNYMAKFNGAKPISAKFDIEALLEREQ